MATWLTTFFTSPVTVLISQMRSTSSPKNSTRMACLAGIGREDFHHIPAHTEFITDEIDIVALVLDLHQLADQLVPVLCHARAAER